ncbi:HIT domain-containing protein [Streptomyces sp. NPDC001480]|uniref:HIT domain-containing protein n=1 Tax=Streptomyces sp. NPDC001480 TaxID=3364577 RepID=UPI0036B98730
MGLFAADPACTFCGIVSGRVRASRMYEDAQVLSFMDIHPAAPGDLLVIPKAHAVGLEAGAVSATRQACSDPCGVVVQVGSGPLLPPDLQTEPVVASIRCGRSWPSALRWVGRRWSDGVEAARVATGRAGLLAESQVASPCATVGNGS